MARCQAWCSIRAGAICRGSGSRGLDHRSNPRLRCQPFRRPRTMRVEVVLEAGWYLVGAVCPLNPGFPPAAPAPTRGYRNAALTGSRASARRTTESPQRRPPRRPNEGGAPSVAVKLPFEALLRLTPGDPVLGTRLGVS